MSRYWRVRDCALEEAAAVVERSLRFHRMMQKEASTEERRWSHYHQSLALEGVMNVIRGMKVESCHHDHVGPALAGRGENRGELSGERVMTLAEIKVFQVATEFIVAADEESAVKFYHEMVGEDDISVNELDVDEVPREKWPKLEIVEIDEKGHPTQTFQQAIEEMLTWDNQEYPKWLATTEY